MNFKFSIAIVAALSMLASVANAQSGSLPSAPAAGSGARVVAPTQTIQSVPSVVGSDSRVVAPAIQSVPSAGSDSRVAAPVIQSVPSADGSSSRLEAPVVDTYVAPTQSYVPTQSYSPSSGCCQSYSVPTYTPAPQYHTRSWGGWFGRRGCGY